MVTFQDFIYDLQNWGVADVLLPFILIFTLIFAILQKTKVLGEKGKRFNVIIALVIGFTVVIPHILSPSSNDVINIMNRAFPSVSIFIVAILALFLLIGMWSSKEMKWGQSMRGWVALISAVIVIAIFTYAAGWWGPSVTLPDWLSFLNDPGTVALIIIVIVFIIVIMYITGGEEEKKPGDSGWNNFIKSLGGEEK